MLDDEIKNLLNQLTDDNISNTKKREIIQILFDLVKLNTDKAEQLTLAMEELEKNSAR